MANPDECVQEFSSLTEEELQVAEEFEDEIKDAGATYISIKRSEDSPNKMEIWGPTVESVEEATETYITFQKKHA